MDRPAATIAILDDEAGFRRALARVLAAHGLQADSFATGEELIAVASARRFRCILLDLHMAPGMSGFEVLAALRQTAGAPSVIVITGHDDPDLDARVAALDAIAVLRKPIRIVDLLAAIATTCEPSPPVA